MFLATNNSKLNGKQCIGLNFTVTKSVFKHFNQFKRPAFKIRFLKNAVHCSFSPSGVSIGNYWLVKIIILI